MSPVSRPERVSFDDSLHVRFTVIAPARVKSLDNMVLFIVVVAATYLILVNGKKR